jgi:23S rRNA (adenine2503-C2)-methyltransferase
LINAPDGVNIGMRQHQPVHLRAGSRASSSLAQENLQLTLSVSLHCPDDTIRSKIMPVNRRYEVDKLLSACKNYFEKTGRRISFEYAMIDGVNDTPQMAALLCKKLRPMAAHVNLIPLNNVEESPLKPSSRQAVAAFQQVLERGGITATVRRTLGSDIDASCGQLRRKYETSGKENA